MLNVNNNDVVLNNIILNVLNKINENGLGGYLILKEI